MRVFLIRHGQTVANEKRIYSGQCDYPLSDQGRAEAAAIAPILADFTFDRVYSSDLCRAVETQRIALPDAESICTPLLREFDVGSIAGKPFGSEVTMTAEGGRDYTPFGGESTEMVRDRLKQFFDQLVRDPCENAAVFTHNGAIIAALSVILNTPLDSRCVQSNNCAIHVFEYKHDRWFLLAWNYMGKLCDNVS